MEIILRWAKMFAQFIQRKKQTEGDQLDPPDADKIRSLAALMEEVGLAELMYGIGDGYIRLKRQENTVGNTTEHSTSQRITIFSPCVGIIKATSDSGEPFVRLNDQVIEGQILAQLKQFGELIMIQAPRTGRITRIYADEVKDPVKWAEYGAPLFDMD